MTPDVWVWRASLEQPPDVVGRLAATLSADERARAAALRAPGAAERFTVGRGVLRAVLGGWLRQGPDTLRFTFGVHGKPALAGGGPAFNLTHSSDLLLIVVAADGAVGVDVERLRPVPEALRMARRFFPPGEADLVERAPAEERDLAFLRLWTRREAVLKAAGLGWAGRLGAEGAPALHEWSPLPGYVAALARFGVEGPLRFRNWHPSDAGAGGARA